MNVRTRIGVMWPVLAAAIVLVWACGDTNLFGPGAIVPPQVDIFQPNAGAGVSVGDSVLVEATITPAISAAAGGVERIRFEGVSHTGDASEGTAQTKVLFPAREVVLDPPAVERRTVGRFLVSNGDTTSAPVYLKVTATDEFGNEGADSVQIVLGAPGLRFISPQQGETVAPGSTLTVEVEATDPDGVTSIEVVAGADGLQPSELPVAQSFSPPLDTARLTQTVTVPNQTGVLRLTTSAVNDEGLRATVGPITVNVSTQPVTGDEAPPALRVTFRPGGGGTDGSRVESTDDLVFEIEGGDVGGSGVVEVGVTLLAEPRSRATVQRSVPVTSNLYTPARSGSFSTQIAVPVSDLEALGSTGDRTLDFSQAPDTVDVEFYAYMIDGQGNCAATISSETLQSLTCADLNGDVVAEGASGQESTIIGVAGQTVSLPFGGLIADAVVDTVRNYLVLSNIANSRLDIFDLNTGTFTAEVGVGSEPWGMTFSRFSPDSLYVANSGGTNFSVVDMVTLREDVSRRIQTPNALLWEVTEELSPDGNTSYIREFYDFTDRPQFLAQDSLGGLVFSTVPTEGIPETVPGGTIRVGITGQGPDTETVLFTQHAEFLPAQDVVSFANIDFPDVVPGALAGGDDGLSVRDHRVGDLDDVVETGPMTAEDALAAILATPDVYAEGGRGTFDTETLTLSDTTFVAAAGDGSLVAIGEGATAPAGRVFLYRTPATVSSSEDYIGAISAVTSVIDLVGNSAERVLGVALNHDGTFGAARGELEVYYFDEDLRRQGASPVTPGGAGVALHPFHSEGPVNTDPNVALAFAGTGEQTIEIFDTRHFRLIGSVTIRENVTGQLRALLPTDADQPVPSDAPSCTDPGQEVVISGLGSAKRVFSDADGEVVNPDLDDTCVVVKLAGVAANGGVVVVNVTKADVVRILQGG